MIEIEERGWAKLPGFVCEACLADPFLMRFVAESGSAGTCTYCERPAVVIVGDDLMEIIAAGVYTEWTDPDSALIPYDGREGGYQADTSAAALDVLWEVGWPFESDALAEAVADAFTDHSWVSRWTLSDSEEEWLGSGWRHFRDSVLHKSRYLFVRPSALSEQSQTWGLIPPTEMLDRLGEAIMAIGATDEIAEGTMIARARTHSSSVAVSTGGELGTPPVDAAHYSNRMSPAGIPMFYGALTRECAEEESLSAASPLGNETITSGYFRVERPLQIVSLADDIDVPSLYDPEERYLRAPAIFMNTFAQELSRPVKNDNLERLEYVPTQIVTEYVRDHLGTQVMPFDGIAYRSAQADGGVCVVLFVGNDECGRELLPELEAKAQVLTLDISSLRSRPVGHH